MHLELRSAVRQLLKSPGFTLRRHPRPRPRDRRERRALQRRQLGVSPPAPVSRTGPAGQVELDQRGAEPHARRVFVSALPRSAGAAGGLQPPRLLGVQCVHVDRTRRSRTADRPLRVGDAAADAWASSRRSAGTSRPTKIDRAANVSPWSAIASGSSASTAIGRFSGRRSRSMARRTRSSACCLKRRRRFR